MEVETYLGVWEVEYAEVEMEKYGKNDTASFNTIGMEPSASLAYPPVSEHHHPTISMIGGNGGCLEIEVERERYIYIAC